VTERDLGQLVGLTQSQSERFVAGSTGASLEDLMRLALDESPEVFDVLLKGGPIPPGLVLDATATGPVSNRPLVQRRWQDEAATAAATTVTTAERAGRANLLTRSDVRSAVAGAVVDAGVPAPTVDHFAGGLIWATRREGRLRRTFVDVRLVSTSRMRTDRDREVARTVGSLVRVTTRDADEMFSIIVADDLSWTRLEQHLDGIREAGPTTLGLRDVTDAGVRGVGIESLPVDLRLTVTARYDDGGVEALVVGIAKPE
jgi:hypothetical protein